MGYNTVAGCERGCEFVKGQPDMFCSNIRNGYGTSQAAGPQDIHAKNKDIPTVYRNNNKNI